MPKRTKQYVLSVDGDQPAAARRYRVAARDERTAESVLRRVLGTGSVRVLYRDEDPAPSKTLPLGQCRKELPDGTLAPPVRYDAPMAAG